MRQRGFVWLLAVVALLSCKTPGKKSAPAATASSPRPRNLVLVTIDTLRADHLHCYGYSQLETPAIDAVARQGALFENAVAQAPLTPASHASIFTGQYPNVHGVRNTGGFVLPPSATTLATILQRLGWDRAAFVGSTALKKAFGLGQGFAVYDDEMATPAKNLPYGIYAERRAGQVVDRAVRWLDAQAGKPFFLWVHVYDPHAPYAPPAPFRQRYAANPYDGEIAYTDHELARLFQAVARKSPPDKTLLVVMADHGESLGEHGEYTHGVFLYDSTLRIPLIIAGPGIPPGLRVREQVRTIDVLPTILDLIGEKAPPAVQGVSLAPAFSGRRLPATISYAETLYPKINMGWSELRAVRTDGWKYIQAPRPELYNLSQDAFETRDVISGYTAERQRLQAWLDSIAGAGSKPEKVQTSLSDRRTMDQLRSLGYLSGFSPREFELTGKGIDPKDRLEILRLEHLATGREPPAPLPRRIELLHTAVGLDPRNPAMYSYLGQAYAEAGRHDDALQLYLEAIRKEVPSPKLYGFVAELYLRKGEKDAAIAYYEKARQADPTDVRGQGNLAMAYIEKGRLGDAERVFRGILAVDERFADAYNGLGIIAVRQQKTAEGRADFERAVRLDPGLVEAQLNLGLLYRKAGDRARAKACFEAFLKRASPAQYGDIIPRIREELALLR